MHVKIFDCESEIDLEIMINEYLENISNENIIDIKYQIATLYDGRDQIYCFTCMIILV